jgi:LacI family transcriptional regulator
VRVNNRVSIHDVAAEAGVSAATVSRVLNDPRLVAAESLRRVRQAMDELGYRPNKLASNLRRQKVEMIGAVVSDVESPHFAQMVRVIETAGYRKGYRLLLCNTDEMPAKQADYLEMLAGERVSGIILSPSDPGAAEISEVIDFGIPIVAIDRHVHDKRADAVLVNNEGSAREATNHLIEAGHERIGFIGGPSEIDTAAERLAGYVAAMHAASLEPRSVDGHYRVDGARDAAQGLLDGERVSALVVANDLMTIGAMQALRQQGLSIPRDVSLVAIDDPIWCALLDPPLTALAQPIERAAETAVAFLLDRINGRRKRAKRETLDCELHVRGSVRPPRRGGRR